MHRRPLAIGVALLACFLALAGCTGDDPAPAASSTVPTAPPSSASTPPTPRVSPTASLTPKEWDLQSAAEAVTEYWRVIDEVASDPKMSLNMLATVARSQALEQWQTTLADYRSKGWVQRGTSTVKKATGRIACPTELRSPRGFVPLRWDRSGTIECMETLVLAGDGVLLRPLVRGDCSARQRYGYHADIERGYGSVRGSGPMTDDEAEAWYSIQADQSDDPSRRLWMIEAAGELVGSTDLHAIRDADAKARFAIGMFSPQQMGRGYGSEATRLVLGYAFESLGLHRVDLRVLDFNERAIHLYRRCGFVTEGRERESCRINESWHDDVVMAILAHEHRGTPQNSR